MVTTRSAIGMICATAEVSTELNHCVEESIPVVVSAGTARLLVSILAVMVNDVVEFAGSAKIGSCSVPKLSNALFIGV